MQKKKKKKKKKNSVVSTKEVLKRINQLEPLKSLNSIFDILFSDVHIEVIQSGCACELLLKVIFTEIRIVSPLTCTMTV